MEEASSSAGSSGGAGSGIPNLPSTSEALLAQAASSLEPGKVSLLHNQLQFIFGMRMFATYLSSYCGRSLNDDVPPHFF
ncbi:hypothetical protein CRE_16601 [Caenorhabditis remanei]|uniref:Uncharacterized protein n=1 Tax=Caenorhabditis remanei TaxID=31234 RepID=E3MAM8_CAERE|nr:hypothetical protein CRE_16601 [Caenorhabditis remanei]